jgi:Mn-dependent DtxR family transcriptional regulator
MTAEEHVRITEEHTRQIAMLLEHGQEVNQFLNRIAEAQLRLAEAQNRQELAQAETAEKLNALIAIVDETVRGRGNGKQT